MRMLREEVRMPDCYSKTGIPRGMSKVKVYFNYTCPCTSRKPDAMTGLIPICMSLSTFDKSHSHTIMSVLNHIHNSEEEQRDWANLCFNTLTDREVVRRNVVIMSPVREERSECSTHFPLFAIVQVILSFCTPRCPCRFRTTPFHSP